MKLKFDSTLSYQLEAIKSVTDLFEGQPTRSSGFQIDFGRGGSMYNDLGIGNDLLLSQVQILAFTPTKANFKFSLPDKYTGLE